MRVTRVLDIFVLLLLAVLLVIPRPDATAKAALTLGALQKERVAELQSALLGEPDDVDARVELANLYLDSHRPDWALATIRPVQTTHDHDYRLEDLRAIAYADRFEAPPAYQAAAAALKLCELYAAGDVAAKVPPCGEAAHARLSLLHDTLERIRGLDMKSNLPLAKERILEGLHPAWIPRQPKAPAAVPKAPATGAPIAPGIAPAVAPGIAPNNEKPAGAKKK